MRSWLLVGALLCLAAAPAAAQTVTSSRTQGPPTEVGGKSLKQWASEMRSPDPSTRQTAIRAVVFFGKAARDVAPELIRALRDRDASCRVHAALSMMAIAEVMRPDDVGQAVRTLAHVLNHDREGIVRFHAAAALSMFGSDARPAIPNLISQMRDPYAWETRRAAVIALTAAAKDDKAGPDPRAVHALADMFLNPSASEPASQVRLEAVMGIGSLGRPVDPTDLTRALQALHRAARDSDKAVTIWAYVSIMALDHVTDEGLNAIAKYLKGKDQMCKMHAARALATIGRDARSKVPDLIALLDDRDPFTVAAAVFALGEFGPHANQAVTALNALAQRKDQDEAIREAAKEAVQKISGRPASK